MRTFILPIICSILFLMSSCHGRKTEAGIKKIALDLEIQRFDLELFEAETDSIPLMIDYFYNKYQDFLEIFSYHIISIGLPSERAYQSYLKLFLTDHLNREVFKETKKAFPDLKTEEKILTQAFKRYKYYFDTEDIPKLVAFVSRFNNSCFTVGEYVGIGLDMYLGPSSEYYSRLDIPNYIKTNMTRKKIPSDVIYTWASEIFPFNDSVNNALAQMIHQGKLMYFTQSLLPDQSEELIMGYSRDECKWLRKNEKMMWVTLIENKLLFSFNQMDIRKLTGVAPFTYFFTNESPGRAGVWIGLRIVQEFAKRNPAMNLKQIMEESDYQKILQQSKYNP